MASYQRERKRISCYFVSGEACAFIALPEAQLKDCIDHWTVELVTKDTVRIMKAGLAYIREQAFMENVRPAEDATLPAAEAPANEPFPFR